MINQDVKHSAFRFLIQIIQQFGPQIWLLWSLLFKKKKSEWSSQENVVHGMETFSWDGNIHKCCMSYIHTLEGNKIHFGQVSLRESYWIIRSIDSLSNKTLLWCVARGLWLNFGNINATKI